VSMSSLPTEENYVRFEIFMVVTMKNVVFWDVTLCGSCKNRLIRVTKIGELGMLAVLSISSQHVSVASYD
jgi:hypothetical protein